ncbi:uncharacterized protein BJ212DRAFT_1408466 [Suillus subaureus]|uniref:Uncharacterized protein n=1 Tax=Suillus subaureus TaxID=48587 RepID=A0A9P7ATT6_9AGAM|nr:uncharacterized protein BJ212DRAFT_1408466 [Suillus subaureus]KAG1796474.1 hypothetical protein BJ212DRAFT_1408466 [Suillus subaureus]
MRFSLAIILAVAASSISATPIDANTAKCPFFCDSELDCQVCPAWQEYFFCIVNCVSAFTLAVGTDKRVISDL